MRTKIYIVIFLLALIPSALSAQKCHWEQKKEEIKARKVQFITSKLDLSVKEAQDFWPVFNEFDKKSDELFEKKRDIIHKTKNAENLTDIEIEKLSDDFVQIAIEEALLKKEYHTQFKKVLPIKKVMQFYQAEHKFRQKLMEEMRHNEKYGRKGKK